MAAPLFGFFHRPDPDTLAEATPSFPAPTPPRSPPPEPAARPALVAQVTALPQAEPPGQAAFDAPGVPSPRTATPEVAAPEVSAPEVSAPESPVPEFAEAASAAPAFGRPPGAPPAPDLAAAPQPIAGAAPLYDPLAFVTPDSDAPRFPRSPAAPPAPESVPGPGDLPPPPPWFAAPEPAPRFAPEPVQPWAAPAPEPAPALAEPAADGAPDDTLAFELIGIALPSLIGLTAKLGLSGPVPLDRAQTGIYRPVGFRAAPWSGFSYDEAADTRTGISADSRIMTNRGEVAMKDLMPGDEALCLRGPRLMRITWIGRRISGAVVAFDPGSLGEGLPRRRLLVAADQPMFIEAVPVTAATLARQHGDGVAAEPAPDLLQICVGFDEVVLAEGVPLAINATIG